MLGKIWLGLVAAALVMLLSDSAKGRKSLRLWLPVVAILGPPGLLIWRAAGRERRAGY